MGVCGWRLWSLGNNCPVAAHLTSGLANADSWATDFHKWLNVPYDSGLALVRDADSLRAAMAITAEYLPTDSPFRNPSDCTSELSRRARGVEVWAALRSLGRSGVIELVERNCRQARRFAEGLRSAGYQVINEVALNQVLVVFGDAETTHRVVRELQTEGTCWCGVTVWQGRTAMRISVSPGWDLVGVVNRLGDGVSGIEPGQIIAALPISGAYAECAAT